MITKVPFDQFHACEESNQQQWRGEEDSENTRQGTQMHTLSLSFVVVSLMPPRLMSIRSFQYLFNQV